MSNIINFFKPNLKLLRGTRLTSGLFIGASIAIAAGILFAANIYYDIDTSKIMIENTQQATTTQITANTGSTALTVTQRGAGAAFSATSTSAMTSDIFKITNLGSGKSLVVEDSDTDTTPFIIDTSGNVGIATSSPEFKLDLWGALQVATTSGPIFLVDYGTGYTGIATSTPSSQFSVQGQTYMSATTTIADGLVVGGSDLYVSSNGNVGIGTTAPGYKLTVSGGAGALTGGDLAVSSAGSATTTISSATSTFAGPIVGGGSSFIIATTTGNVLLQPYGGNVGIASSTPSALFSVGGNIISSGNLILYGSSTSTIAWGLRPAADADASYALGSAAYRWSNIYAATTTIGSASSPLTIDLDDIRASSALTISSTGGKLTLQPLSGSDLELVLGGSGLLKVGSSGQFYIDASGNATTSGNIYASAFISSGSNAYTRKAGDQIVRGVVPIFGFDLPARCSTSCYGAWVGISRYVENDPFPSAYSGTTRKHKFSIRYADATTTPPFVMRIATTTPYGPNTPVFNVPASSSEDLTRGNNYLTAATTTVPTSQAWRLDLQSTSTSAYAIQIYEIMLIAVDEVN